MAARTSDSRAAPGLRMMAAAMIETMNQKPIDIHRDGAEDGLGDQPDLHPGEIEHRRRRRGRRR